MGEVTIIGVDLAKSVFQVHGADAEGGKVFSKKLTRAQFARFMTITAFAPAMETFERGRNFSAWLGLVPKQHSTGGRQILGRTSKMGQKDIRRLLIIGAMSVIKAALKKGAPEHSWLGRLLARKSRMVAGVALANKMARMIWAVLTGKDVYRDPEAGAAA